jgi:integrative and conjugative element protein (TIGR02256 family)
VRDHFCVKSADGRFGVSVADQQMKWLIEFCRRNYPMETGGILVGHYTADLSLAVVTKVVSSPEDSAGSRSSFRRGVHGLQKLLIRMWPNGQYYLGEWHFHPDGPACPSRVDDGQMVEVANSIGYRCPEPLLLIVAGKPPTEFEIQTFVFVRGSTSRVELRRA